MNSSTLEKLKFNTKLIRLIELSSINNDWATQIYDQRCNENTSSLFCKCANCRLRAWFENLEGPEIC